MKYKYKNIELEVDWIIFNNLSQQTCFCSCEQVYRSHAKGVSTNNNFVMVTKEKCPGCNEQINNCRRYASDTEKWEI